PGFSDWRPVSEFRVARKTEVIVLDDGSAVPPAIRKPRQRSAPAIALICISVLALIFVIGMTTGKFRSGETQHARIEAKTVLAQGQIRIGMSANEVVSLLGEPKKSSESPARKKNSGPTRARTGRWSFIWRMASCDIFIPIDGPRFLAGSQVLYTPSCSTPTQYVTPATAKRF